MASRRSKINKPEPIPGQRLDTGGGLGVQVGGDFNGTIVNPVGDQGRNKPTLLKIIAIGVGIASGIATILALVFSLNPSTSPGNQPPDSSDTLLVVGVVRDRATDKGIPNAWFTSNKNWKDTIRTTTDGTFEWKLRAEVGESVRVYAEAIGYSQRNEYKTLQGPLEIYLDRDQKTSK